MAHYDDYHGAYFTIQDIRKELVTTGNMDLLNRIEFVIVDNNPDSAHGQALMKFAKNQIPTTGDVQLVHARDSVGTSYTRDKIIEMATGDFVLVMDCHVLLCPVVPIIKNLFSFMKENPEADNLYQGPLMGDSLNQTFTHFNDRWGSGMWGQWGSAFSCNCGFTFTAIQEDECIKYRELVSQKPMTICPECKVTLPTVKKYGWRMSLKKMGYEALGESHIAEFPIPSQGLGLFLTNKNTWLGFNPYHRGFGGEEGYIHEKYRQHGREAICLSWLKWLHRFNRPDNVPYPLKTSDKARNYILEFTELNMNLQPVIDHFLEQGVNPENIDNYIQEATSIYGR